MQWASGQSDQLTERSLQDLLTLFRLLEDRPTELASLLSRFESPGSIIERAMGIEQVPGPGALDFPATAAKKIQKRYNKELLRAVESDLRWLEGNQHHIIVLGDSMYPSLLAEIPDPPVVLFCRGDPEVLSAPQRQ